MQPQWQRDINHTLGQDYTWQTYATGSSNHLFLGHIGQDQIVLRRNAPATLTPGVNRYRESMVLSVISDFQWAPHILRNHVEDDWCAMAYYPPLCVNQPLPPPQQQQLFQAISQLQGITPSGSLSTKQQALLMIDYNALWDQIYLPQATANADTTALTWIDQIRQGLHALPPAPLSFVHHDLHRGNLAKQTDGNALVILDWEYAGLGNPWLDAAALADDLDLCRQWLAQLPAFKTVDSVTFQQGLNQAIEIKERINQLWYRVRTHR